MHERDLRGVSQNRKYVALRKKAEPGTGADLDREWRRRAAFAALHDEKSEEQRPAVVHDAGQECETAA